VRYLDPDLPSVLLHPETLESALVNLVKNAIEAMPNGGQLMVRTRVIRGGVAVDMIDTGCGMDERTLFRMFDPFYTTKSNGTGLGLPTAKKIIEAHGGRIDVQSAVGLGTKFTLEFPLLARLGVGHEAERPGASSDDHVFQSEETR
jgi:signal transduction histidine kinase